MQLHKPAPLFGCSFEARPCCLPTPAAPEGWSQCAAPLQVWRHPAAARRCVLSLFRGRARGARAATVPSRRQSLNKQFRRPAQPRTRAAPHPRSPALHRHQRAYPVWVVTESQNSKSHRPVKKKIVILFFYLVQCFSGLFVSTVAFRHLYTQVWCA
jgi:hypothetical protein